MNDNDRERIIASFTLLGLLVLALALIGGITVLRFLASLWS